jgi:hypothetical protein
VIGMTLPNFLIIGAQKAGTTALYHALAQHPQVFMSPHKEPAFFAYAEPPPAFEGPPLPRQSTRLVTTLEEYAALFADGTAAIARGEASTFYSYCWTERTAGIIHRHLPDVRLIVILRQPAERAYSAFNYHRFRGLEPLASFRRAVAADRAGDRALWHPFLRYYWVGCYAIHLQPYINRFPPEQLRVYLYEDWQKHPATVLADCFRFLGVDERFDPPPNKRYNVSYRMRSRSLNALLDHPQAERALLRRPLPRHLARKILHRLRAWNQVKPPPLGPALRRELTESYREDILSLQDMIGRNLSHWLE